MNINDVFVDVFNIVEQNYFNKLRNLKYDVNVMLHDGIDPKTINKEENRLQREFLLSFKAEIKIALVVEIFVRSNYSLSDAEIAFMIKEARKYNDDIPSLERSSVGRYLTDSRIGQLYSQEIYTTILQKRKENLQAAKSKGGKAFAQNNIAIKDELGQFRGSTRR